MSYTVAAFYHFFDFPNFADQQKSLLDVLKQHHIKGSILIADEGFNGTISGTKEDIDAVLAYLREQIAHSDFEIKLSTAATQPFGKAKVRLKKETISIGEPVARAHVGTYIEPKDWNALIADPDTIILDTRNAYETHLGTFKNAIDPGIRTFKQLPGFVRKNLKDAKHKKIATFCTGGIRCEKFTAWMKQEGFKHVYHLKGGILKYLEEIPEEKSLWHGECYVFDERIAIGHGLNNSETTTMCNACGHPLTPEDRKHKNYIEGKQCGFCD